MREPWIDFGRDLCADPAFSGRREWLATNGIGGFASGTVAGILTRRYHGLLVAALSPPLGRTLLVANLEETARYDGRSYPLAANRWASGITDPNGFLFLDRFHLEGAIPVWTYAFADALLTKRVFMRHGANTTYIRYDLRRSGAPLVLLLKGLVNYRDYHGSTHADDWRMRIDPVADGIRVVAFEGAIPFSLLCGQAEAFPQHNWYRDFYRSAEASRGLDPTEDHLHAVTFQAILSPGSSLTVVASAEESPDLDGEKVCAERQARENRLTVQAGVHADPETPSAAFLRHLILAADQFLVRRPTPMDPKGSSLIAGYPWFSDWGRDTMVALPGLTLCTGRPKSAAAILRTVSRFVDRGMLPNRFPDAGKEPEYNTVDAALWYFEAIRAYHEATGDDALLRDLFPVLADIIDWHRRGTRYRIRVDPKDGLLFAGEEGVQLTWMDAKVGDWVVTLRIGKPVEINALWYNALRSMAGFARRIGKEGGEYEGMANQAGSGFDRYWNEAAGCCFDVLDTPHGNDASLRPNQLLAVSLEHSALPETRQKAVVDVCARRLLTPHGLRSLDPDDPRYAGRYGGDPRSRDAAYHQGTVWAWLIGPFVLAHLRVHRDPAAARSFLAPLLRHLRDHGLGTIGEIFDGDPPFSPRGCIAQAWSVGEVLRALHATRAAAQED